MSNIYNMIFVKFEFISSNLVNKDFCNQNICILVFILSKTFFLLDLMCLLFIHFIINDNITINQNTNIRAFINFKIVLIY